MTNVRLQPHGTAIDAAQSRMARSCLDMTLKDVEREAKVSHLTIGRFERETHVSEQSKAKLRAFYESKGVRFLNGEWGSGVLPPKT